MRGAIHIGTFWHPEDGTVYVVGPDREVYGRKQRGAPVTLHSGFRTICGGPGKVTKKYWGELTAMHSSAYRGSSPPRPAQAPPRRGQVHMRTYADARVPRPYVPPPEPARGFKEPGRGGRGRPIRRPGAAAPTRHDVHQQVEDQFWLDWELDGLDQLLSYASGGNEQSAHPVGSPIG